MTNDASRDRTTWKGIDIVAALPDRRSQYAATGYHHLLTAHGLTTSVSRRGNCWDSACVERFFGTVTRELIYRRPLLTRDQGTQGIVEYLTVFYRRMRRVSTEVGENQSHPDRHKPISDNPDISLALSDRKNSEEKILLRAQTLIYLSHTVQHFYIEGGWRSHGDEESSSKEARQEGGKEEEVVF